MSAILNQFDVVERELISRELAGQPALAARIRRRYDAPQKAVWAACTDPDRLNRWFLQASGDLREGGTFALEGNAHGEILHCDAPRRLVVTWCFGDAAPDEVELRLSPIEGGTLLELEHASSDPKKLLTDPETGQWGIGAGWELPLSYLTKHFRGQTPDQPSSEWWELSEDDIEYARWSSDAWAALVAAGPALNS